MNEITATRDPFMTPDLYNTLLARYARHDAEPAADDEAFDPPQPTEDEVRAARFDAARNATIQSFRNRLGRDPSEMELRDSMPLYMTDEDRKAYMELEAARRPYLARFFPTGSPASQLPFPPPVSGAPTASAPADGVSPASSGHPYLDAIFKTGRALVETPIAPILDADVLLEKVKNPDSPRNPEALLTLMKWWDDALRSHVAAYDAAKSDPGKSYQTYTKERLDLGPCRFSEKLDPRSPCYYAGVTGNEFDPEYNVGLRDQARYPTPSYKQAQLDCSTRSWVAARAREQQLIDYYRGWGLSDNLINSIADHVWRPYMMELAARECGDKIPPLPVRR